MKNYLPIALMTFLAGSGFTANAQMEQPKGCGNVQAMDGLYKQFPGMEQIVAKNAAALNESVKKLNLNKLQKTADDKYIIPIVFHIIHNYGVENISDAQIYDEMRVLNEGYNKGNANLSLVINKYKPLIADVGFEFRLARLDPNGKPTTGIDRIASYKTYQGDDQSKLNYWPPDEYINVWVTNSIGSVGTAGYAYKPDAADAIRFWDGVIILNDYIGSIGTGRPGTSMALTHEIGHVLNLDHLWGSTNSPGVACGDDGVDDTPLTKGYSSCPTLYPVDSACTPKPDVDTANIQNYMEYSYCPQVMFTLGQKDRMITTLKNSFAGRDVLVSAAANAKAGMNLPQQDVAPKVDFNTFTRYICTGTSIQLKDFSFGDTVSARSWDLGDGLTNNAAIATVTYTTPGWKNISLTATSNAGSNTLTRNEYLYVADATPKITYINSFEYPAQNAEWPTVNTFGNKWKWSLVTNAGYFSTNSMMYNSFEDRPYPLNTSGNAVNDWDDIYTPVFDLSNYQSGAAHFNFFSSGASTSQIGAASDRLIIQYSRDCGKTWNLIDTLKGLEVQNMGFQPTNFKPAGQYDWKPQDIKIPAAALTSSTMFRVRFMPGVASNNLYIDEMGVSAWPTGVSEVVKNTGIAVYPNPSNKDVNLNIRDKSITSAKVVITDISGRTTFTKVLTASEIQNANAILPSEAFGTSGIYLLNIQTNTGSHVEKLIRQ